MTHLKLNVLAALIVLLAGQGTAAEDLTVRDRLRPDTPLETSVDAVAFSPDGGTLAAATNTLVGQSPWISKRSGQGGTMKGAVILWDVAKKARKAAIECAGFVRFVAFSPDGKSLALVHSDGKGTMHVRIVDAETRKDRHSLPVTNDKAPLTTALAIAPDGKTLVVGTGGTLRNAKLILIDPATGKERKTLTGGETSVASLSFSSDGSLLASISEDTVQVWDMTNEKLRNSFSVGRGWKCALSPDGEAVAVATIGSRKYPGKISLTLRDARTGKERVDFQCLSTASPIEFTPDGKRLVGIFPNGIVGLFDTSTGKRLAWTDGPAASSLAVSRKGNLLATGNHSGSVWLWGVEK